MMKPKVQTQTIVSVWGLTSRSTHNRSFRGRDRQYTQIKENVRQNAASIHRHQTPSRYLHAAHGRRCTVQPPRFGVAPITAKRHVIRKPEMHDVAQRRQSTTEPRPQEIRTRNFVKIGSAVPEIRSRTDRRTDRRVDHNTPHPYRGRVTIADKTQYKIAYN